jgi:predicted secreted protein
MTAGVGRNVVLTWGGTGISGVKEKTFSLNNEPIDITSDDDAGWRNILGTPGQKQVELKVSGVTKDRDLIADWFSSQLTQAVVLTYENGATITGQFFLSEYSDKGNFKDAVSFDATLMSTGAIVYTAGV